MNRISSSSRYRRRNAYDVLPELSQEVRSRVWGRALSFRETLGPGRPVEERLREGVFLLRTCCEGCGVPLALPVAATLPRCYRVLASSEFDDVAVLLAN